MEFVFDLPVWIIGPGILLITVAFAVGGLTLFRRYVLPRMRFGEFDTHFSAAMLASIMVLYGLAMALIAVHVWVTYEEVAKITSTEATALGQLYRDVSEYPQPTRGILQTGIREYVEQVLREAWPQQRRGIIPRGGVAYMDRIQATLMAFEPSTEGQKLLAGETLRAYNNMILARRMRVDAGETHLPWVMWWVIILGAAVSLVSAFL